jgi:hypothetical protein
MPVLPGGGFREKTTPKFSQTPFSPLASSQQLPIVRQDVVKVQGIDLKFRSISRSQTKKYISIGFTKRLPISSKALGENCHCWLHTTYYSEYRFAFQPISTQLWTLLDRFVEFFRA